MKTILVACETVKDEIIMSMERHSLDYPVVWLEGGLHNSPEKLKSRLQKVLDEADGHCQRLLFSLGYCGGGVSDLKTGAYETVVPLADDCLSLLLGSMAARKQASQQPTFFLTEGWLRHENNVATAYESSIQKFGQKKADRVNSLMFGNYSRFGLIDTGTYDISKAQEKISPLATAMNMATESLPGDLSWLDILLLGPHDTDRFLVLAPHSQLTFNEWAPFLMNSPTA